MGMVPVRRTIGLWLTGTGLALAALGAVPAALQAPLLAWAMLLAGLIVVIVGAVYTILGPTPGEWRAAQHDRDVERHSLESERDELNARLQMIGSGLSIQEYWLGVASNYGDRLRAQACSSNIATFTADREGIDRRLSQITTELSSL